MIERAEKLAELSVAEQSANLDAPGFLAVLEIENLHLAFFSVLTQKGFVVSCQARVVFIDGRGRTLCSRPSVSRRNVFVQEEPNTPLLCSCRHGQI